MNKFEQPEEPQELPEGAIEIIGDELKDFQELISQLKANESQEGQTSHLTKLNPEDLVEEDEAVYNRLQALLLDEGLTEKAVQDFYGSLNDYSYHANMADNSRREFVAFVRNKAMALQTKLLGL